MRFRGETKHKLADTMIKSSTTGKQTPSFLLKTTKTKLPPSKQKSPGSEATSEPAALIAK